MRRPLALLAAAAASVTTLVAPLATPAHAIGCRAVPVAPHLVAGTGWIRGAGAYHCYAPVTGITVTVCVERAGSNPVTGPWTSLGCTTTPPVAEATDTAFGEVLVNVPLSAEWLRTTVTGSNDTEPATTEASPPVFWFNCACIIV